MIGAVMVQVQEEAEKVKLKAAEDGESKISNHSSPYVKLCDRNDLEI